MVIGMAAAMLLASCDGPLAANHIVTVRGSFSAGVLTADHVRIEQ
jgi:hypothetical protein